MENETMKCFKLFRDVCRSVNSTLNLKEVLELITKDVVKALDAKGCAVFLLDTGHKTLNVSAYHGLSEAYMKKGPVDMEKSIAESLSGKAVAVYDAANDPRTQYPKQAKTEGVASILSVPIPVKCKVIGVMRIYTSEPRRFPDNEIELVCGLAEMSGIAIDNARMYDYLKKDHENLITEVHRWFDYGNI